VYSARYSGQILVKLDFGKINNKFLCKSVYRETSLFMQIGQTDVTKLIVDFRNFANAPKSAEYVFLVISGLHRALLQSNTFISRLNALDYVKLRSGFLTPYRLTSIFILHFKITLPNTD